MLQERLVRLEESLKSQKELMERQEQRLLKKDEDIAWKDKRLEEHHSKMSTHMFERVLKKLGLSLLVLGFIVLITVVSNHEENCFMYLANRDGVRTPSRYNSEKKKE